MRAASIVDCSRAGAKKKKNRLVVEEGGQGQLVGLRPSPPPGFVVSERTEDIDVAELLRYLGPQSGHLGSV